MINTGEVIPMSHQDIFFSAKNLKEQISERKVWWRENDIQDFKSTKGQNASTQQGW